MSRGSSTFSFAVSTGSRPYVWTTSADRSNRLSGLIDPASGSMSPAMTQSRVDLPAPEAPVTAVTRPGSAIDVDVVEDDVDRAGRRRGL